MGTCENRFQMLLPYDFILLDGILEHEYESLVLCNFYICLYLLKPTPALRCLDFRLRYLDFPQGVSMQSLAASSQTSRPSY